MSLKIKNSRVEQSTLSNQEEKPVEVNATVTAKFNPDRMYFVQYFSVDNGADMVVEKDIVSYAELEVLVMEQDGNNGFLYVTPL